MRSRHIAMSWDEYDTLPPHPGWKQEYWDGIAHITPASRFAVAKIDVVPRAVETGLALRAAGPSDESALISAYVESFRDTVEYCDWKEDSIQESARDNVRAFFARRREEALLESSCLAVAEEADDAERVAAAALIVRNRESAMLDMLFVRPRFQRRGLATALVSWCLGALHRRGETTLRSRYLLANDPSRAWHLKFGFVEEPDLLLARVYRRCAAQELHRRERTGELPDEERVRLRAEEERWERLLEQLEGKAEKEGWEAVSPSLRLR